MATPTTQTTLSFEEKHHFLLRKLHSLTGIIPIGAFLIEHLLTNSAAFDWFGLFNGGRDVFNEKVHWIHNLPFLLLLEVFFIFLPLAFHALYGIKIAMSAHNNSRLYPYMDNRRFVLQRLTGYIAVLFLIVHLLKFRFAHLVGWGPEFIGHADPFEVTRVGLTAWSPWGFTVPAWITMAGYVIGLAAACFHFGNGIWSFCISWGITIGQKAQDRVRMAGLGVAAVLFIWGCGSLYAFGTAKPSATAAEHAHDQKAAADSAERIEVP